MRHGAVLGAAAGPRAVAWVVARVLLWWQQEAWSYTHSSWGLLRAEGPSSAVQLGRGTLAFMLTRITVMKVGDDILLKSAFTCENKDAAISNLGHCSHESLLLVLRC